MACSITTRKEEMIRLSSFSSFNRGFFLVPFFGISTLGYSLAKLYPNVLIPKKGTKKNPLLKEEKEDNRIISSFRVVIEHAIAGVKRFQIVTNTLRNKIGLFDDLIMEVCSGLWNFHLRYRR